MCCKRRVNCCIFFKTLIVATLVSLVYLAYKTPTLTWHNIPSLSQLTSVMTINRQKKSSFSVYHGPTFSMKKVKPVRLPSEADEELPKNPPAVLTTNIPDNVEGRDVEKAYRTSANEFFWGKTVKSGDYVELIFVKAVRLGRVVVTSGAPGHEGDKLLDTTLQISTTYNNACDNKDVKQFHDAPVVDYEFPQGSAPLVHCVRLVVNKVRLDNQGRARWLIIRDFTIN